MAKSRRRGGNEDPTNPRPETLPAESIPADEPVNIPPSTPQPPKRERPSTLVASDSEGGRKRKSRKIRKSRKSQRYSRRR
jgi:hypothetical protein